MLPPNKKIMKKKPYINWTQINMTNDIDNMDDCIKTMTAFATTIHDPEKKLECPPHIRIKGLMVSILVANVTDDSLAVCKDMGYDVINRGTIPRPVRKKNWEKIQIHA